MTATATATSLMLAEFARLQPQIGALPAPAFTSLAGYRAWLAAQAITNTRQTQIRLTEQLQRLNALDSPGLADHERDAIIEELRTPLHFVQNERSKAYRLERPPLPLPAQEAVELQQTLALWQALIDAYSIAVRKQLELSLAQPFAPEVAAETARLASLALITARFSLLTALRAGLRPRVDFWRQADCIYFIAEHMQATRIPVADKLTHTAAATVSAHYIGLQLLAAAEPHGLSLRELQFASRWVRLWASKVPLLNTLPAESKTAPLCIKLASGQPAQRPASPPRKLETATWRWLDMHGLRKTLKQRLQGLLDGRRPDELKLGKSIGPEECRALLQTLYARWCKADSSEINNAQTTSEYQLVAGLANIHQLLGGRTPAPAAASTYLRPGAYDQLATLGHIHPPSQLQSPATITPETWQVQNLNLRSLLLQQPSQQAASARLCTGQLLALRENATADWQLARLLWLRLDMDAPDGPVLQAAAERLPGLPNPLIVYPWVPGNPRSQPLIALQLPALPQLKQAASLLLPPGHFQAQLKLEIRQPQVQAVQLTRLLARGPDHDWCAM